MRSFVQDTSWSSISFFIVTESRQKLFRVIFPTAFTSGETPRTQKIIYLHMLMRSYLFVHNRIAIIEDKQWNNWEGKDLSIVKWISMLNPSRRWIDKLRKQWFFFTLVKVLGTRLNRSTAKIIYSHLYLSFDWSEHCHFSY